MSRFDRRPAAWQARIREDARLRIDARLWRRHRDELFTLRRALKERDWTRWSLAQLQAYFVAAERQLEPMRERANGLAIAAAIRAA